MRTKASLKFISVFLASVMLFGAVSVMPFTASAATTADGDLVFTAKEIYDLTASGIWGDQYGRTGYDEATLYEKNGVDFVRLVSNGGKEAYFNLFYSEHSVAPFVAIKYRVQFDGAKTDSTMTMQIYTDSKNEKPGSGVTSFSASADGKWHLAIIDLKTKITDYDGSTAKHFRFDFINRDSIPLGTFVDIEYIAFFNSEAEATSYDAANSPTPVYVASSSPYSLSTLPYYGALDMINGMGLYSAPQLYGRGGNSKDGTDRITYNGTTLENNYLVFTGWSVVDGGISKYVWSADGGKTWNDVMKYNGVFLSSNNTAYTTKASNFLGVTFSANSLQNSGYQGSVGSGSKVTGLAADLTQYKDQTVDVLFAAVPVKNTSTVCVLHQIENVFVGQKKDNTVTKYEYSSNNSTIIENANQLANGVDSHYVDSSRDAYVIENQNTKVNYDLVYGGNSTVKSITNLSGMAYIQNTMKVYAKTTAGKTYYASNYTMAARPNIYRMGYYYYENHFMDTDFINSATVESTKEISASKFSVSSDASKSVSNSIVTMTIKNTEDPYIYADGFTYNAESYNCIQFDVKSEYSSVLDLYVKMSSGSYKSMLSRYAIKSDGEWHTYTIPTDAFVENGYTGTVRGIRFDFDGLPGTQLQIRNLKIVNKTYDDIPLTLDRTFHTYSDKLHQEVHVVAYEDVANIAAIGISTEISESTVAKIIVKDKNGTHTSLSGIDWASAEYVGFDIKNVGVFGYILPYDGKSGTIKVTLSGGVYTIIQEATPTDGMINAPVYDTSNDFRMGHRIYTDANHTFDAFLKEADAERNPLTAENIKINIADSTGAKFKGYDPIRGVYFISLEGAPNFNVPYYDTPNKHYTASIAIEGDGVDRSVYFYSNASSGALESAVLLDVNDMLLPVPMEVCKNFSEGEEPIYNFGDNTYSNTIFPVVIGSDDSTYLKLVNLYQNWGKYPLKQLSSIGFYMPYYHLSTGVTETNCISMYSYRGRNLGLLPDHRGMSSPFWDNQPQHTNVGNHIFLNYENSSGNFIGYEYNNTTISSYGPTYADVSLDYMSDDGKIKINLNHIEMPQTDENRTYYEITYTVLEDLTISNFREDFSLYTVLSTNPNHKYKYLGLLDSTNNNKVVETNALGSAVEYHTLGPINGVPYFDLFYCADATSDYGNLAFIIKSANITIGGVQNTASFVVKEDNQTFSLTLDINQSVTLKAGDSFKICAILMPWGGGWRSDNIEADYDESLYSVDKKTLSDGRIMYHVNNDASVRKVRMELLSGGYSATAVSNCSVVKSAFLPTVKTNNGSSAEFTIKGGFNNTVKDEVNITVLAEGFNYLGVPKIEEKVNGTWVEYEVSSKNSPDGGGNAHDYDGYSVTYENGKYNYSFVTTIYETESRTFRITVEESETKGLEYELNADGKSFTLVGIDGAIGSSLIIPAEYGGLPVTGIAAGAISAETVKTIKIPASVTYISNENAFIGHYTGVTVQIDPANTVYQATGNMITEKSTGKTVWIGSKYGNVNGDLNINVVDVAVLREYIANYDYESGTPDFVVASGADLNGDGQIDTADLALLRQYFANYNYTTDEPGIQLGKQE